MYDAMKIILNKIIKSNEHKAVIKKSKVASIQIVTTETTQDSGYDDNSDRLDQQQKQQQVDQVNIDIDTSQDNVISKKRKISVDEIHSKKIFEADNKKNNCDDSSNAKNIQISSLNENLVEELHMIDMIEKEKELFTKESITIKDEMLPVTDDLIDVDKINNYHDHSFQNNCDYSSNAKNIQIPTSNEEESVSIKDKILLITGYSIDVHKINNSNDYSTGLEIKSNEISNFIKDNNQSCSHESIVNVDHQKSTTEATCESGYDNNYDQLNQQQQQVDKVNIDIKNSQDNMISKKRKLSVEEIQSEKMFEADNKKNNCDDPSFAQSIQITSLNENSFEKLHMIDFIEKEEQLFTEQSITIKDDMLPVTDDSIDVEKINNSHDYSIGLKIKSNEISDLFENNHQSCSNKVIEIVDYQKNTRIRTGSLAPKKYSVHTEEDDDLSSTAIRIGH